MAENDTPKTAAQIQAEALNAALTKASECGNNYVYCPDIYFNGEDITEGEGVSHSVSVRWLDQNRYLYSDNTDEAIAEFKSAHKEAVKAGYVVYDGDKPDFVKDADKYVDNNIDVFMRKGHYENTDFYQTSVPSYIDSESYDGENYDTNGNETSPLYYVSDEIKLDENE